MLPLLVLLLTGCRLDVAVDLVVERDGTVTAGVLLRLDPDALTALDALEVDPTAELAAVAGEVQGWEVTRTVDDDGSLVVRLAHAPADAATVTQALRDLAAGLAVEDPALLLDLDLAVADDGAAILSGTGGFRPPATPGATLDGDPVGPDADELARLTAEALDVHLTVTFAGDLADHDADVVDGRTASWELPVGEPRTVDAAAAAPGWLPTSAMLVAAGLALVTLVAVLVVVGRRRRR